SDVCSSDLPARARPCAVIALAGCATALGLCLSLARLTAASASDQRRATGRRTDAKSPAGHPGHLPKFVGAGAAAGSDPATSNEVRAQPDDPGQQRETAQRSEEHTSELQSRENLVCRLLLEKKKTCSKP